MPINQDIERLFSKAKDTDEFDSFLDLEEELEDSLEAGETMSSIEETEEVAELDDEFVMPFDDETVGDELAEFSFGGEEAEEQFEVRRSHALVGLE